MSASTENEAPDVPIASAATSNAEKTGDKLLPAKAGKTAAKAKKKGTAKRKDKNKPKRPLSAYNYFFKEDRKRMLAILRGEKGAVNDPKSKNYVPEDVLEGLTDAKGHVVFPEMAKVVASHWKNVGDEEGARLRALAKEDLDRYNKQMRQYYPVPLARPHSGIGGGGGRGGGGQYGTSSSVPSLRPHPAADTIVPGGPRYLMSMQQQHPAYGGLYPGEGVGVGGYPPSGYYSGVPSSRPSQAALRYASASAYGYPADPYPYSYSVPPPQHRSQWSWVHRAS